LSTILISAALLFIIVGTVVGNILVCVAVCLVRRLRRPCNYLLVSLAVSDLCVALLVMPMALVYEVLGTWPFGASACDTWVAFDVLSCTASILNLCMISVDRYWAITRPLDYGVKRTPARMISCVALVWISSACISLPPLLVLGNEHGPSAAPHPPPTTTSSSSILPSNNNDQCQVCQEFGYQIYATLGSFYIPLAVMAAVYYQIFQAAKRIVDEEKKAQSHLLMTRTNSCAKQKAAAAAAAASVGGAGQPVHRVRLRFALNKERKASTTLGIIMSAFTLCWFPFFVLALVRPFMSHQTASLVIPRWLSSLFLWLGYANSFLNPVIYATTNKDFRLPFREILCLRCKSLNSVMREDFYQSQYGN
ncbi:hypothetical protein DAPPUDRAFT_23299, partial [Daphnia pulex]